MRVASTYSRSTPIAYVGRTSTPPKAKVKTLTAPGVVRVAPAVDPSRAVVTSGLPSPTYYETGIQGGGDLSGGGAGPSATDVAALEDARLSIRNRIDRANQIYNAIFGDIDEVVADRRTSLEKSFNRQYDDLASEQLRGVNQIGGAYAARGLSDSSYRINALDEAAAEYGKIRQDVSDERRGKLAELGQYKSATEAGFRAGQDYLGRIGDMLPTVTDLNSLLSLRSRLEERIGDLGSQRANLKTESQFIQGLGKLGMATNRVGTLKDRLSVISNSDAPLTEKARIARGFISTSGVSDEEKRELLQFYNSLETSKA